MSESISLELCEKLRAHVGTEKCAALTDQEMKCFLGARNGNIDKAAAMLTSYLEWYHAPVKGVPEDTPATIRDKPDPDAAMWPQHFPFAYRGHDRDGCPIYWEKTGKISSTFQEGKKHTTEDRMVWHHILKQEVIMKTNMAHASKFYGKDVTKQVAVLDLSELSYAVDTMALSYVQRSLTIDQNYYPERLKHLILVNAPWFFSAIWALIWPFVDANTAKKIVILGSDFLPKLREYIDDSQIPAELGGSRGGSDWAWLSDPYEIDSDEFCAKAVQGCKGSASSTAAAPAPAAAVADNSPEALAAAAAAAAEKGEEGRDAAATVTVSK